MTHGSPLHRTYRGFSPFRKAEDQTTRRENFRNLTMSVWDRKGSEKKGTVPTSHTPVSTAQALNRLGRWASVRGDVSDATGRVGDP